jgi:2-oxoisovalerate dehydrogenase E1 component
MQLLLARTMRGPVPEGELRIPLGRADVKRRGMDATVVAWGAIVHAALQAAAELEGEGIDVEVIDLRSLVPLDLETVLASVGTTRRLVVAHSAVTFSGFGAEIAALVSERCFGDLKAPVRRVGAAFTPVPRAMSLVGAHSPGATQIAAAVRQSCR